MFRLLKKLTSRLVRVFGTLLPLVLAAPAMAQWGAVTSQPDTNRFINSQQDFGLIMPHQQVIVGLLDTTITSAGTYGTDTGAGNASKVIVGSLLDYEDNCANYSIINGVASCAGSYEKWRELEKSTSWYQADRGDTTAMFPTNYAMTISTGKDSVNIWNRDTAELWMAFIISADANENLIQLTGGADARLSSIAFKDGILYNGLDGANGNFNIVDILEGGMIGKQFYNGAGHFYNGNIQQRNDGLNSTYIFTYGLSDRTVTTLDVTRDPFGLMDGLGRPKHWWVAGTLGDNNTYNPHTDTIYKWGWGTDDIDDNAIDERGFVVTAFLDATINRVVGRDSEFIRSAINLGAGANHWASDNTGDGDIAWDANVRSTDIVLAEPVPWAQNRPRIIYSSAAGVYNLYSSNPASGSSRRQARQRFSATVNAPLEFGNAVGSYAFEDNTTDSSPYANTLSVTGSPSQVTAIFGNGVVTSNGNTLYRASSDAEYTIPGDFYMSTWIKSAATSTATNTYPFEISNAVRHEVFAFYFSDTAVGLSVDDGGASGVGSQCSVDAFDAKWHHVVLQRDVTAGVVTNYLDGVLCATTSLGAHTGQIDADRIGIGQDTVSGNTDFTGTIDDFSIGHSVLPAEAVAKLHAEGRKKLAMGTPVFTRTPDDALISNNVVEVDALDNGMWAVAFSDANTVQVFDGRIPVQEIAAPAGTVKSIALIQSPGADSVGVAIGTTTNLKFVQPSVNLRAAMAHRYQEPISIGETVVVDSSGIGGIFWTAQDAVDAAYNAYKTDILVLDGTYGGFNFLTGVADGMHLHCSGARSATGGNDHGVLFDGGGTRTAVNHTSNGRISNCGFYTAPGGAGGDHHAVELSTGSYGWFDHNVILDSDAIGIHTNMGHSKILSNHVEDSDEQPIYGSAACDASIIGHNTMGGSAGSGYGITVVAGGNYVVIIGNTANTAPSNSGTGGVTVGNATY